MYNFDIKDLDKVLNSNKNIILFKNNNVKKEEFDRRIIFGIKGKDAFVYTIEWWKNICYLEIDNRLTIPFDRCYIDGCWPNKYKYNLNFEYEGIKTAILGIEEYEL